MPYRYAHYFVGAVLLVILGGFWFSYFTQIGQSMPAAFHVHAITSIAWLLLLIAQHVAIHRRHNALHKQLGKASFVLFPALILGFVMIINVSAARFAGQEGDFIMFAGPSFGIGMTTAIAAYLTLFYLALKHRRNVKLHAGYMLATPLILFESPFSRLMDNAFPWMNVIGSPGPQALFDTIVVSNMMASAFALALYFMDRKHGAPWLIAIAFMTTQSVLMWFSPGSAFFSSLFAVYAGIPPVITVIAGVAAGGLAGWLGWQAGKPAVRAKPAVA